MIRTAICAAALAFTPVALPLSAMAQSEQPPSQLDSLRQAAARTQQGEQPVQIDSLGPDRQSAPPARDENDQQQTGDPAEIPKAGERGEQPQAGGKRTQPAASRVAAGGDNLGSAIAATGDMNGDGVPDYAVGAFAADSGGDNAGCVLVVSGATDDTLHYLIGENARDNFGFAVAAADLNGDLTADIVVGAPNFSKNDSSFAQVGRVYVFDGRTGSQLRRIDGAHGQGQLGYVVAYTGDVDGDGTDDFAAAERAYQDSVFEQVGAVHVYSGKTMSVIHTLVGREIRDRFGAAIAAAGDVDGDGYADLWIGAHRNSTAGISAGRVYLFSGQSGEVLYTVDGRSHFEQFGSALAAAGDLDGDGVTDFAVGAPASDDGAARGGRVYLHSGRDGRSIAYRAGTMPEQQLGSAVAECGDLNSDGVSDLIAGAGGRSATGKAAGAAYALSGRDAEVIFEFGGERAGDNFGRSVAGPGDLNGDGTADLLIGAFGNDDNGIDAGKVYLYSGRDRSLLASVSGRSSLSVADTVTPEKPAAPVVAATPDTTKPAAAATDSIVLPDIVYNIEELDNPPFLRRNVEAVYPPSAIGSGATGWVQVRVLVLDDGMPGLIEIADDASLGPVFRASATAAARQWEFAPATKDGKDVASWTVVPIGFQDPGHGGDTGAASRQAGQPRHPDTAAGDGGALDSIGHADTPVTQQPVIQQPAPAEVTAEPVDTAKNYDWSDIDKQPSLVQQVNAEYPVAALESRDTATVMVRVLVLRDGSVGDVQVGRVTNPGKGFEESATAAIKRWRFEPGQKGGLTVRTWVNYPIRFTLPD